MRRLTVEESQKMTDEICPHCNTKGFDVLYVDAVTVKCRCPKGHYFVMEQVLDLATFQKLYWDTNELEKGFPMVWWEYGEDELGEFG